MRGRSLCEPLALVAASDVQRRSSRNGDLPTIESA
jgi:hypothetical protein